MKIGIIGAGIAGLSAAYMLENQGYEVALFEAADTVRGVGAGMGLAANAMQGFAFLGLEEVVKSISFPLTNFRLFSPDNRPLFAIATKRMEEQFQQGNFSVHRADLHAALEQRLQTEVRTAKAFEACREVDNYLEIQFTDGAAEQVDYLIGADGVNSAVRQFIFPETPPRYAGYWCWRGVIEAPEIALEGSRAYWGKAGRFGMTPLTGQRWYWFACVNAKAIETLADFGKSELREQFANYPQVVQQLLGQTPSTEIISGPVMDIRPLSHFAKGKILLIGDAAHAATPNMGQGACMAVEDVAVLQDELQKQGFSEKCFTDFERRRLARTRYIIKNSRLAGKIAQSQQTSVIALRNWAFRNLPSSWTQAPLHRLYSEDFMQ